jgi:hypothetical protein
MIIFAYKILDRLPNGKDGLVINKPIVVNWKIDEVFLLFGHFINGSLKNICSELLIINEL